MSSDLKHRAIAALIFAGFAWAAAVTTLVATTHIAGNGPMVDAGPNVVETTWLMASDGWVLSGPEKAAAALTAQLWAPDIAKTEWAALSMRMGAGQMLLAHIPFILGLALFGLIIEGEIGASGFKFFSLALTLGWLIAAPFQATCGAIAGLVFWRACRIKSESGASPPMA